MRCGIVSMTACLGHPKSTTKYVMPIRNKITDIAILITSCRKGPSSRSWSGAAWPCSNCSYIVDETKYKGSERRLNRSPKFLGCVSLIHKISAP